MSTEYCVLDVETSVGRLSRIPDSFELLVVGVKHNNDYHFYENAENHLANLAGFLETFEGIVVTFNGKRFDLLILNKYFRSSLNRLVAIRHHYDVLDAFTRTTGYRISLNSLSYYVLKRTKMPWNHRNNVKVWQRQPELLLRHNREDLDITDEIYKLALSGKPLRLGNKSVTLPSTYGH